MPPATFTTSLKLTVSVTLLPAFRSAVAGLATTEVMAGAVVSICRVPAGFLTAPARFAAFPALSWMVVPGGSVNPRTVRSASFSLAARRSAVNGSEGQAHGTESRLTLI